MDIIFSHDAPDYALAAGSADLSRLIKIIRPRYFVFGHHHIALRTRLDNTEIIGLAKPYDEGFSFLLE